jgi:hypothetical protein
MLLLPQAIAFYYLQSDDVCGIVAASGDEEQREEDKQVLRDCPHRSKQHRKALSMLHFRNL